MAIAVLDDYHLLGKRIVHSVLRAGGYDLHDYGRVTVDEAVRRTGEDRIRILLISTLMLPSALHVRDLVMRLKSARREVKVIVGGAPFLFDPQLWREVHADAMGRSASEAAGHHRNHRGGNEMTMPAMTSLQRVLTTLGHQEPDRVPLFLLLTMHGAKELGLSIRDYFAKAENVVGGPAPPAGKIRP